MRVFALVVALLAVSVSAKLFIEISDDADELQAEINQFTLRLGAQNPNTPQVFDDGFRKINWDAAPDNVAEPNHFPSDFFNSNSDPRARGAGFFLPDHNGKLVVSANANTGTPVNFGKPNLRPFSEQRMFGVRNETDNGVYGTFHLYFFMPDVQVEHGWSRGAGFVFVGVADDDSEVWFYDEKEHELEHIIVPQNPDGFSFVAWESDRAEVFQVKVKAGNGLNDVAVDDVLYGEPQRHTGVRVYNQVANTPGELEALVEQFRSEVGELNANVATCFEGGRRQINWDGVPSDVAAPNLFPGSFFNFDEGEARVRGIEFFTDEMDDFQVSNAATEGAVVFGRPDLYNPFSQERVFTQTNAFTTNAKFFTPCDNSQPATIEAIGVIFLNVHGVDVTEFKVHTDEDDSTGFEDWVIPPLPRSDNSKGGITFTAIRFFNTDEIFSVKLNLPKVDPFTSEFGAVLDDFIYSEPVHIADGASNSIASRYVSGSGAASILPHSILALLMLLAMLVM